MSANNIQGQNFLLSLSKDVGVTFLEVGGFQSKSFTFDNNTADNTNSATNGEFTENCWTGYSAVSASGSGVVDQRITATTATYYDLLALATSGDRTAFLKFEDGVGFEASGLFVINSMSTSGDQQGFVTFDLSVQSATDIAVTVTPPVFVP